LTGRRPTGTEAQHVLQIITTIPEDPKEAQLPEVEVECQEAAAEGDNNIYNINRESERNINRIFSHSFFYQFNC
jgi:hypothetical protein